jgi:hypothetical protein
MSRSRVREWGWVAFPAVRPAVFQGACPVVCPVVSQAACPAARPAVPRVAFLVAGPLAAAHRVAALREGPGTRTGCWKRAVQKRVAR